MPDRKKHKEDAYHRYKILEKKILEMNARLKKLKERKKQLELQIGIEKLIKIMK